MTIKNLTEVPFPLILECFLESFKDYFVPLPQSQDYWEERFEIARVNYEFSYGVFDQEKLVAYIIHGTDMHDDILTAFNTGTGVLPNYRGQHLIDKLYAHAFPKMRAIGIGKCMLEVIQENIRAIKVYERIGFKITRALKCFSGKITLKNPQSGVQPLDFELVLKMNNPNEHLYSWDNNLDAIQNSDDKYETYSALNKKGYPVGYFIIDPETGYVAQLESTPENFSHVMNGLAHISETIKINNIDDRRTDLIANLLSIGFENTVNQFEMEIIL